ncbi:MAG TPA: endonuclease domain-containing protein [Chitinophagaceae bacterium]|nr:endonuclease domain-containing protein [Chitinophagaceae bacterium]
MTLKNPYKSGGMFEGASHIIFGNAKHLRNNMTDAEKVLWVYLKAGIEGLKFRRQHPIGLYIADFYCHKAKLIVEIDGYVHNEKNVKEADDARQQELERWGYTIIRFTNDQAINSITDVINMITEKISYLNNLHKQNTPQQAEFKSPL